MDPAQRFQVYYPLTKVEEQSDGTLKVWARATQEIPDGQKEIFDYASSVPIFKQRAEENLMDTDGEVAMAMKTMHQPLTTPGKWMNFDYNDAEKAIDICGKVVDPVDVLKVKEKVLRGVSVGGRYRKRWPDPANPSLTRFTGDPVEISLVDKPAVPTAKITLFKVSSEDSQIEPNPPAWFEDYKKVTQEMTDLLKSQKDERDQQESKLKALGERVGIGRRNGSPKTPPKDYPDDPSEYGDPANFNFPTDEARHVKAVGRFNGGQGKEQYSPSERHAVGRRVARLASRFGDKYTYDRSNQKIVNAKEKKTMNKLDIGALLDQAKSFRDQVDDKEAFDLLMGKMDALKDPSQEISIEHPAISVPGVEGESSVTTPVGKMDGKKPAPQTATASTTETSSTSPSDTTTSTPPAKPPVKKAEEGESFKALDEKINKTLEAVGKLADSVSKMATMNKAAQADDPINDLNSIISAEMTKRMPLQGDPVIKALEANDMYSFQKALFAAGSDDKEDKFKRQNAMNEVYTKMRQATIDELTARGYTAANMLDSHFRPLPQ